MFNTYQLAILLKYMCFSHATKPVTGIRHQSRHVQLHTVLYCIRALGQSQTQFPLTCPQLVLCLHTLGPDFCHNCGLRVADLLFCSIWLGYQSVSSWLASYMHLPINIWYSAGVPLKTFMTFHVAFTLNSSRWQLVAKVHGSMQPGTGLRVSGWHTIAALAPNIHPLCQRNTSNVVIAILNGIDLIRPLPTSKEF